MRYNGSFQYQGLPDVGVDPDTGFAYKSSAQSGEWVDGGLCQIDYQEGRTRRGEDGEDYYCPITIFVPKAGFDGSQIVVGAKFKTLNEDGTSHEFEAKGIDPHNRKYFEIWG